MADVKNPLEDGKLELWFDAKGIEGAGTDGKLRFYKERDVRALIQTIFSAFDKGMKSAAKQVIEEETCKSEKDS